ncbi:MAG TPA: D-hexose-6-phosphate mutarotase [Bacteroidales bacterium]|nr:D-hexose-6-phosphate mutarotase [Bacteroidales bacterium]
METNELNKQFAIENHLRFVSGKGGWDYVHMENKGATAFVSLYGAHVLHYTPAGESDLLWNSGKSYFETGKPIRGGVPICFPWFGPHAGDPSKPMHGFARLSLWHIKQTTINQAGETELVLTLSDNAYTRSLWPFPFQAAFTVRLGNKLSLELAVFNSGNEPFTISEALHTYLRVDDSSKISIEGLKGSTYFDGTSNNSPVVQTSKLIEIKKEENRRYINTTAECLLSDPVLKRNIRIGKHNSNTTVVWNPWIETSRSMADMDDEGYQAMVCIEAANAFDNEILVNPGERHVIGTSIEAFKMR